MSKAHHLNREVLDTLQEIMPDQFTALIETFLSDSEDRIRQLQRALADTDADSVRRQAHSFKGSCNNIGAERLAELCLDLEERGREERLAGGEEQLAAVRQEFSQLRSTLRTFI